MLMPRLGMKLRLSLGLALVALVACSEGGTITVPCDPARCNDQCVEEGDESGACVADTCECRAPLDVPGGPTSDLSSGGVVHRSSSGYQVDLTIGPVAPAAEPGG